ncbi:MAG TPA: hypothetical protein VGG54_22805 [Trebonia sp.]|jgi:hypothetical protein
MTSPWQRAVAEAAEEPAPASLAEAIEGELVILWCDLDHAMRNAYRGGWSIACDNIAGRIIMLSRLVGATPWENISIPLLLDGVYQGLLTDAGIEHGAPGPDDIPKMQQWSDAQTRRR